MIACRPAAAHTAARALAALPVEAVTIAGSPRRLASATTRNEALSFSDPLGFWPSFFIQRFSKPVALASPGERKNGVLPTG